MHRGDRGRLRLAALAAIALLAACGPQRLEKTEQNIEKAIAKALARGDTATLWFYIEVPFAYDSFYVAGPRTPAAQVAEAFRNENWLPEMSRQIEQSDHFHLLVFETRGKLVPAALPKRIADVAPELTGRMYGPDDGRFAVRRTADGGVLLAPLPPRGGN